MSEPAASPNAILREFEQARGRGRYDEALQHLRRLPGDLREQFQILAHEADLYGRLGKHDREIALYDRLLAGWPDVASLWVTKANALKTVGRVEDAIAAARQALQVQPTYGKAWWVLSELKTIRFGDEELAAMQAALGKAATPADRLHLHFALGKSYEDRQDAAGAFQHYQAANELRAVASPPAAMSVTQRVNRSIDTFTREFFEARAGQGYASDAPIFIVGLHRSGSTLIEQILASHPEVEGTGELGLVAQLRREVAEDDSVAGTGLVARIAALDAPRLEALGETYVERATAFRLTDRPRFIDKMPANWLNIGFIRLILPKAKIIDARRHPMAAGFSNFKQNYGAGVGWSYSLAAIGEYYRDYLRLMTHFERVQPGAVHRVVNERLIEDLDGELRKLLEFLGLPFDPACLEFHRTARPVRSASAEQVRRPVSRAGVDQWRAYEPWLGPLKAALGPALEGWDAPPGDYRDDEQA